MLQIKSLHKKYKNSSFELNEFSCEIPNNSLTFVLGKSGSGKSTLLNILSGLDKTFDGSLIIDNKEYCCAKNNLDEFRDLYVGNVFQDFKLVNSLNVKDNILSSAILSNVKISDDEIKEISDSLNISKLLKKSVKFLSGGEKQRVAIARCLTKKAQIILCDEPTGSLDSKNAEVVFSILKEISKTRIVIVVSHNENAANKYADNIININDGVVTPHINKNSHGDVYSNVSNIEENTKLMKNKLMNKMSFNLFKCAPIRTIIQIMTCVISLCGLNFFSNLGNANKDIRLEALYNNKINYLNISKVDSYSVDNQVKQYDGKLKDSEILAICNDLGVDTANAVYDNFSSFDTYNYVRTDLMDGLTLQSGMKINETFLNNFNLQMSYGNLPSTDNQVIITSFYANEFIRCGYTNNGVSMNIENPRELIGKKIKVHINTLFEDKEFIISGILDVPHYFRNGETFTSSYIYNSLNNLIYFSENCDLFNELDADSVFIPLFLNLDKDRILCEKIETYKGSFINVMPNYIESSIHVQNSCFNEFNYIEREAKTGMLKGFTIASVVIFLVLSIGMSFYYFSFFLSQKNAEIDTLRTVGFTKRNILKIYLIYAVANALFVSALAFVGGLFTNSIFYLSIYPTLMLDFTFRPFSILGLTSIFALPILFNVLFTIIFSNVDISKKYR